MDHTIIKPWGNSQGVRLSKSILEKAPMKHDDILQIDADENVIILRKVPRHKTFEERLAEYDNKIDIYSFDWGEPLGKELV